MAQFVKLDDVEIQKYFNSSNSKSSFTILAYQDCFTKILPNLYDLSKDLNIMKNDSLLYDNTLELIKYTFQVLTLQQLFENDFIIKIFDFILNNLNNSLHCSEVTFLF